MERISALFPLFSLCLLVVGCGSSATPANGDAGPIDAGSIDAGPIDAGPVDAAPDADPGIDAGPLADGVSTLAGAGETGSTDGFRDTARFNNPTNVAVGADGTVYVADFNNGLVRKVSDVGAVTTLTAQANFARPFGLVIAANGTLYAQTDRTSGLIDGGALWSIDTVTGAATLLFDSVGRPRGMAELDDGRLVMAFYLQHVIKVYDPATPAVAPAIVAGTEGMAGLVDETGALARFDTPYDVVAVSANEVVVADQANHVLRTVNVDTGVVTTFAGTGVAGTVDDTLAAAQFNRPQALAINEAGDIFVSELDGYVLRKISGGAVSTIAGDGMSGYIDSVTALSARFFGLEGIDVHPTLPLLYVADGNRGEAEPFHRVRRVTLSE